MESLKDIPSLLAKAESLRIAQNFAEAEGVYRQALDLEPRNAAAWHGLGQMAVSTGQCEAGASLLSKAVNFAPKNPDLYIDLGVCLGQLRRWDLAEQAHRHALTLAPDNFVAMANLGKDLWRLNRVEESIPLLRAAIQKCPDLAFAHAILGLTLLLVGQWKPGWEEYEWRLKIKPQLDPNLPCPKWKGEPAPGKTILLCSEQGVGDTIQFIRYVPLVKARVGRVIVRCQDNLVRVAQTVRGVDTVVPASQPAPACDAYALLPSLPRLFGTTVESVPRESPYLHVPASASIPNLLKGPSEKLKVGLVWAGNPKNQDDFHRSTSLDSLGPLIATPGVQCFSLQVGPRSGDLGRVAFGRQIIDLSPSLHDYGDTAAAVSHLDLVISVDTSPAHLAGALGRPVWVLLPFVADWRWLMRGDSCVWYPTMRLFRPPRSDDWDTIVGQAAKSLLEHSKQRESGSC